MTVVGTEKTLTIDANVIEYYYLFTNKKSMPQGLKVQWINDFCFSILDKYPIAINKYIRTEYENVVGLEYIKHWLAKRLQNNLAIAVECIPMPSEIKAQLSNDYGFNCNSWDARYIGTCLNTISKHLVTENTNHFHRPHRSIGKQPMPAFLKRKLKLLICSIDQCCTTLLGN